MRNRLASSLLLLLTLTLAACTGTDSAVTGSVRMNDPSQVATIEGGWTVSACDGEAPLLCVVKGGAVVGIIEMLRFPAASFDSVDPAADLETNIAAVAADFLQAIGADRAAACGPDYRFEPLDIVPVAFADQPAFRYGYRGTMADGSPSELNLQFATITDDEIILVTAIAYDAGGCPGRDDLAAFDTETLLDLEDEIEVVVRGIAVGGI